MEDSDSFVGSKLAIWVDNKILTYKRDNIPTIPSPDMWDLPGGGREQGETPEQCVLRELKEEFGLEYPQARLHYKQRVPSQTGIGYAYFFAMIATEGELKNIVFGHEGQYWQLMPIQDFLNHPAAIPAHKIRLENYLASQQNNLAE